MEERQHHAAAPATATAAVNQERTPVEKAFVAARTGELKTLKGLIEIDGVAVSAQDTKVGTSCLPTVAFSKMHIKTDVWLPTL